MIIEFSSDLEKLEISNQGDGISLNVLNPFEKPRPSIFMIKTPIITEKYIKLAHWIWTYIDLVKTVSIIHKNK
jgi:hypothetical protein